jgi:hypothetical protein
MTAAFHRIAALAFAVALTSATLLTIDALAHQDSTAQLVQASTAAERG